MTKILLLVICAAMVLIAALTLVVHAFSTPWLFWFLLGVVAYVLAQLPWRD